MSPYIRDLNPALPVTFRTLSGTATIDQIEIADSGNLVFDGLRFVTTYWGTVNKPAMRWAGEIGSFTMTNCEMLGNFRGVVDDPTFDPTDPDPANTANNRYAELAAINPTAIAANGSLVAPLVIARANVTGLLSDQTGLALSFAGGTGANGTVDVVGGVLTNAVLTSIGSGFNDGTNDKALTNIITWAGQQRYTDYGSYGIQQFSKGLSDGAKYDGETGTTDIIGPILIRGNTFRMLKSAVRAQDQDFVGKQVITILI